MADWDQVRELALSLPETSEVTSNQGLPRWLVRTKMFAWERPLRRSDLAALGEAAPDGPILGAKVADEGEKWALVNADGAVYFTTPHFNGYPAILVQLDAITVPALEELLIDAWLCQAPKRVAKQFLTEGP